MTVNLTRIYTKLGDSGETHLGDMSRVSKTHPRVEAYGTVDELNAALGVALLAPGLPDTFAEWLRRVQNDLLDLGADLSVPGPSRAGERGAGDGLPPAGDDDPPRADERAGDGLPSANDAPPRTGERPRLRVTAEYTDWLEHACDEVNATLPPLRSFVIPGGTPAAAHLHVCRTVCRRAERRALAIAGADGQDDEGSPEVVRYLNRLSDLLFILARAANEGASEPLWDPGAHGAGTTTAAAPRPPSRP